jgi:hypothetical protein
MVVWPRFYWLHNDTLFDDILSHVYVHLSGLGRQAWMVLLIPPCRMGKQPPITVQAPG